MIGNKLNDLSYMFEAFCRAVDECTDVADTAQLAIFMRSMDINFSITEELAAVCSMKGSIQAQNYMNRP
jgi:hypothetical protein